MSARAYRTFQALILAILGIFLLFKIYDGKVLLYINQRFVLLVLLGALGCMLLSQAMLRGGREGSVNEHFDFTSEPHLIGEEQGRYSGWTLWWLALPLLMGLLVPQRPLGASALANRAVYTTAPLTARSADGAQALELPAEERNALDWIRAFHFATDPAIFVGQPANVTGFVYHDPRLEAGQFLLGRFTLTCCVADAMAIGMVVEWQEAESLPDNAWVSVQGEIALQPVEGQSQPKILAKAVQVVPEPLQPYLFP